MFLIILTAICVAGLLFLNKMNGAKRLQTYTDYYAKKRREFPWLDNWIKQYGDPAAARVGDTKFMNIVGIAIYYVLYLIIFGLLPSWGIFKPSAPVLIIFALIGVAFLFALSRMGVKDPSDVSENEDHPSYNSSKLTLECPSCHCPHAWVLTQQKIFVDGDGGSMTKTTTTRKTTGGGLVGASQSILNDGTTTKYSETHNYYGRTKDDYKCLNCGHTLHCEEEHTFGSNCPDEGMHVYDPPVPKWGYQLMKNAIKQNQETAVQQANEMYQQEAQSSGSSQGISGTMIKAAEMGSDDAKFLVGVSYLLGQGVEKDEEKARQLLPDDFHGYIRSNGSFNYYQLGLQARSKGRFDLAIPLYELSVSVDNDASSCWYLGNIYSGQVGPAYKEKIRSLFDKEKARQWYQKGADMGDKESKKALKNLK